LAPIVADPAQARLPASAWSALGELAHSRRVSLGIVSGRVLTELRRLVGVKNVYFVGSHGLEWLYPDNRPLIRVTRAQRSRIRKIGSQLRLALHVPGIHVECKPASVALHYRNAGPQETRQAIAAAERLVAQEAPELRRLKGKKVIEFLPAGGYDKGLAVGRLLGNLCQRYGSCSVVYFGDDTTDEAVFARLRSPDLSVLVGSPRRTKARFYLRSPSEVCRFLQNLASMLK